MANSASIRTAIGTYVHSTMAPEVSTLLAAPKTRRKSSAKRSKRIAVGAEVLYMGHPATVVGKHPTNRGWWTVEITREDGTTTQTSGDRSLIKVL